MNKSESIKELAGALAKAQGEMSAAKMDAVNPFLKNKYADLGSVIQAAKSPLAKNGLSYTQLPSLSEHDVTITTVLMHESGEWLETSITLPLSDGKGLSLAQSVGALITYLRRYSLSAVLGIYADEDTDGNGTQPAKQQAAKQEAPKQTEPAKTIKDRWPFDAKVSYETACTVKNSDGLPYTEVPADKLSFVIKAVNDKLTTNGLTDAQRAELELKRDTVKILIDLHK